MIALTTLACLNAFFLTQGDTWLTVDPFSGAMTRTPLSTSVNAMAHVGGVVYGLAGGRAVTISPDGTVSIVGRAPAAVRRAYAATAIGGRWVFESGGSLVSVDVPSLRVAADVPLSARVRAGDLDYWDGSIYALADTSPASLVRIAPSSGRVTTIASLPGVPRGGQFGAISIDPLGVMHALHNVTGRFFAIPLDKPSAYFATESTVIGRHTDAATCPSLVDYGDAPASYGVASHVAVRDLAIGVSGTTDDGLASPVVVPAVGSSFSVAVPVLNGTSEPALLAGWLDLEGDGRFEASERVTASVMPGARMATLTWPLSGAPPSSARAFSGPAFSGPAFSGPAFSGGELRLRLFGSVPLDPSPVGPAVGGEVEDYPVTLSPPPSLSPPSGPALPSVSPSRAAPGPVFTVPVLPSLSPPAVSPPPLSPAGHASDRPKAATAVAPFRPPARRTPLTWAVFVGLIVPALIVAARIRR